MSENFAEISLYFSATLNITVNISLNLGELT